MLQKEDKVYERLDKIYFIINTNVNDLKTKFKTFKEFEDINKERKTDLLSKIGNYIDTIYKKSKDSSKTYTFSEIQKEIDSKIKEIVDNYFSKDFTKYCERIIEEAEEADKALEATEKQKGKIIKDALKKNFLDRILNF